MKHFFYSLALSYIRFLARIQLKKHSPDIVGITGSAGKTTCMHAVAAVLSKKYRLKVGHKVNSELGIPLNILGITPWRIANIYLDMVWSLMWAPFALLTYWHPYDTYVVEMGIDSPFPPKNMGYLLTILSPRVGILLNAEAVHSEPFDELISETEPNARRNLIRAAIAAEKGKLIEQLPENGLAILNADDPFVMTLSQKTRAAVMTFGTAETANVRIDSVKSTFSGSEICFHYEHTQAVLKLKGQLVGQAQAYSLAAALCLALDEDYTLNEGVELLTRHFHLPPGRMSVIPGIRGSMIIDSSYNASLQPMLDALFMLTSLPAKRRIALLGDMRELGKETQHDHEALGEFLVKSDIEAVLVGPLMQEFILPIFQAHGKSARWFADAYRAADYLHKELKKDDVLLVKGSQNTLLLEIAVEHLMAYPERAEKLLCRRGVFWDKKRADLRST